VHRSARSVVADIAELSDAGRDPAKQVNEDSSGYAETRHGHLAVVCDGMGGHSGGREASQTAVRTIVEHVQQAPGGALPGALLREAIEAAGQAVYAVGGDAPTEVRPGSTCVAMLLHERGAEIAHVGDSRGYLIRSGAIQRVTNDHSMVQQMVDAGVLTPEEALDHPESNKITRALGMHPDVDVELRPEPLALQRGDVLLLCSDGLTDLVSDSELGSITQSHMSSGPAVVCQQLVALANDRGGYDNITVELLHVLETPARQASTVAGATWIQAPPGAPEQPLAEPDSGAHTAPSPTITDATPHGASSPTVTDATPHGASSPTLLDGPPHAERSTEPGPVAVTPFAASTPRADGFSDAAESPASGQARHGRWMVLLAAAVALLIVGGVAVWAIARFVSAHRHSEEVPPPPEEPSATAAPLTVLEASTPPEPEAGAIVRHHHHHRRDARAPDAAPPPDAGQDGGDAGFP
jgi:serine/threonine protein phosphatase PrpC